MARIEPPEDEQEYWDNLKDYEKGNAIEVFEMWEYNAQDYLEAGKLKFLKSQESKNKELFEESKEILRRAIEKGSEEARTFWNDQNLNKQR